MQNPKNAFKEALLGKSRQIGCWLCSADAGLAEVMGSCGFEWVVIDGEHAPNDIRSIRDQLVALHHSPSSVIVRIPSDADWMIKQVLDAGAQTVLVPMVETAQQAKAIVSASRYPPDGVRGMGAAAARATMFGSVQDYATEANDDICVVVQVETVKGMDNLAEIAAVDGVDGVFIGPADLSADMGFPGNPAAPEVQSAMQQAADVIGAAGKASGSLALDDIHAQAYLDMGYSFLAVGIDLVILTKAARDLSAKWRVS